MPTFKKPTINIGSRQAGRVQSNGIINVSSRRSLIKKKIDFIYSKEFNGKNIINPYKKSNTSKKIITILKNINLKKHKNKKFYDLLN